MDYKEAFEKVSKFGQEHIFQFWEELSKEEQNSLLKQVSEMDFEQANTFLNLAKKGKKVFESEKILPPKTRIKSKILDSKQQIVQKGEEIISKGKIACLLVAGGQGSRLGYEGPKGCYNITPVKNKSLFQVFAEQIISNQNKYETKLYWYIMTSILNHKQTQEFFEENNYFGLEKEQIFFFSQKLLPAIDKEGKFFLSSKYEIFKNPNGHGGVYEALLDGGIIKHMQDNDIKYVSFVQVDNCVIDVFDPAFIGLMEDNESDFGMKTVKKVNPEEKVGLICNYDGKTQVLEYSNISSELTHKKNEDDDLLLNAVNLNTPIIRREFIEKILKEDLLPFNVAFKQINHLNEKGELIKPAEPNGFKFEKFVFDVMPFANNVSVIQTEREDEFAPVKNAEGVDSPLTARLLMNRKAKKWMLNAGFDKEIVDHIDFAEISPIFALTEEDFKQKVKGKIEFYENEMIAEENFYFE